MKQRSYSMQKVNFGQKSPIKRISIPRPRLNFPLADDPSLFSGVGRKHYHQQIKEVSSPLLKRNQSQNNIFLRDTLNVRDIEGAYPSIKPQSQKNKLKLLNNLSKQPIIQYLRKKSEVDSLQKMQEQFDLKQSYNPQYKKQQQTPIKYNKIEIIKPEFGLKSDIFQIQSPLSPGKKSSPRSYNPTYISNWQMY